VEGHSQNAEPDSANHHLMVRSFILRMPPPWGSFCFFFFKKNLGRGGEEGLCGTKREIITHYQERPWGQLYPVTYMRWMDDRTDERMDDGTDG